MVHKELPGLCRAGSLQKRLIAERRSLNPVCQAKIDGSDIEACDRRQVPARVYG
jgi:hypothetical protein